MIQKLKKIFDAEELEDDEPITEENKKRLKSTIKYCLLGILCIVGLSYLLGFVIENLNSCERRSKNEWTTVNVHDCFYIDIPPMMEIVTGKVSTSGITRGIWDEESSCFQLNFWAKSMSATPDESPYAVAYISYDVNPFECVFGEEEIIDMPEDVVYSKIIEPTLNEESDSQLTLVDTPLFGKREINGRNFYVVEYTRQAEGNPPCRKQWCLCHSTNGSAIAIEVACDSEEWMDDMMKIIETIKIP